MRRVFNCMVVATAVALLAYAPAKAQPPEVKPGPEHERLKQLEGTWDATVKMTGGGESKGTMVYKMEINGLWLVSDFKSDLGGAAFQGKGLDSYDPVTKKYVSVWIDSMSTIPMTLQGDYDQESKTTTMAGEGRGPDGKMMKMKFINKMEDKDSMLFTIMAPGPDGKEGTMMTIQYKRKS